MGDGNGWVPPGGDISGEAVARANAQNAPPTVGGSEPTPSPPDRPRRRGGVIALGTILAVLVVLIAVAFATSDPGGTTDADGAADEVADDEDERSDGRPGTEETGGDVSTTAPTTVPDPPPSPTLVTAPDGRFSAMIPGDWPVAFTGDGALPIGQQLFPHDPSRTTPAEDALVTPETRMFAVAPLGWGGSIIPPEMLVADGMSGIEPDSFDLQQLLDMAKPVDGALPVGAEGRLQGVSGEIAWLEMNGPVPLFGGVRYVITGSDSVWLVTYWSDDLATTRPQADAIAMSFDPG